MYPYGLVAWGSCCAAYCAAVYWSCAGCCCAADAAYESAEYWSALYESAEYWSAAAERRLRVGHGAVLGGDAHLRKRLPRALIAERCQPTLQSRIAARVHCHIGAEFRVFIGDFRQQDRIGIGILHCCDGLVIINHRDLFP